MDFIGSNGNVVYGIIGFIQVDFFLFYNFSDELIFIFEVINFIDEYECLFIIGDGSLNLMCEYNYIGRQFFLGVCYNF